MNKTEESVFQKLSVGSQGSMVVIVQRMFNSLGYKINENGIYDQNMAQTVRDFQIKRDSLIVDGMVDYKTMVEIDSAIALSH